MGLNCEPGVEEVAVHEIFHSSPSAALLTIHVSIWQGWTINQREENSMGENIKWCRLLIYSAMDV